MDTQRQVALYDTMSLPELADCIDDLDERRTPAGWSPRDAVQRSSLERRIVERVAGASPGARSSLPCHFEIQIRAHDRSAPAVVVAIADGGIEIEIDPGWRPCAVDLIAPPTHDDHGVRIRGTIDAVDRNRVHVALGAPATEPNERRLRRFLREAIRHRTHN